MLKSLYDLSDKPAEALQELIERYDSSGDGRDADASVLKAVDRVLVASAVQVDVRQKVTQRLEYGGLDRSEIASNCPNLLRDVEALLSDVSVQPDVKQRIRAVYELQNTTSYPAILGGLGLYLCLDLATAASLQESSGEQLHQESLEDDTRPEPRREAANTIFQQPSVKASLRSVYSLSDDCDLEAAQLYRIGTTSLIIDCEKRAEGRTGAPERIALKCVLPRHFSVRAITDSTRDYKMRHKILHHSAPKIYDSTDRTVMMEFIEGETLAERLEADYVPELPDDTTGEARAELRALHLEDIEFIRELSHALCDVLSQLNAKRQWHCDLSPRNIILTRTEPLELRLIDFGENYAIAEEVGSSPALIRASVYVEPQLLARERSGDWQSDCYSLGIILLEAASKQPIRRETIAAELWRLWTGDPPWDGAPGLARIIEDLTDQEPEYRLAFMDDIDGKKGDPYNYVANLTNEETEVMKVYESRTGSSGIGLLRGTGVLRAWKNPQLLNMLDASKVDRKANLQDDAYRDLPSLAMWARVAITFWSIILTAFVILTLADLRIVTAEPSVKEFADLIGDPFTVGAFWGNLPGRLVAVTFGLVCVTYYVNNFALLSPKRIGSQLGRFSEIVMRGCALILPLPVLWALIYNPHAWPLCAGIGTLWVVLNNFLALHIAEEARIIGKSFSTLGSEGRVFVRDQFSEWWRLMGYYSVSMILIGVLLLTDVAHDEAIYAGLVVAINVVKMYRLNCIKLAPQVRGSLSRDILTIRRSKKLSLLPASGTG